MSYKDKIWLNNQYKVLGKSIRKIADECQVNKKTIRSWLRKFDITVTSWQSRYEKNQYRQYNWLYGQYVILRKTMNEIADECNVIPKTIYYWIKKLDIPVRSHTEKNPRSLYRDGKWLKQQYTDLKKSANQIGKENNWTDVTVKKWLCKHNIPVRSHHDAMNNRNATWRTNISNGLKGLLVGSKNPNWRNGVSFLPYCHLFNNELKEEIRNRDNRVCQICSKSEILNGRRLLVHHIDGDKMQGCNNKKWYLALLCLSCSSKANFDMVLYEFLIVANNQWKNNN